MPATPRLERRALFGLAGASLLGRQSAVRLSPAIAAGDAGSGTILATPLHDEGPALTVAGPRDGELAAWARRLEGPLSAGLMASGRLHLRYGGGTDGVTGANQFDARATPDGREALLLPGSVAVDWLLGLRPVRLDGAGMLPLLAVLGPGVLMVRGASPAPGGGPDRAPLRLAAGGQPAGAVTALLGLDLLGIPAIRVAGESDADAIFLQGSQAAARAASLLGAGFSAAFSTRQDGALPGGGRAPFFLAGLPQDRDRRGLLPAWHALAQASQLCAALVLPRLSPASAIGRWRQAAQAGLADAQVAGLARRQALHLVAGAQAGDALAPMRLASAPQIALRRWLSDRADALPG